MASIIRSSYVNQLIQWIHPKTQERNLISAAFHMITITLISMSLVELEWFAVSGDVCAPYLTLSEFFRTEIPDGGCVDVAIVNVMRVIIAMCFIAIAFSLAGFFLDVVGPKGPAYFCVRKYAFPSVCTVLSIMAIISSCYYVVILLEERIDRLYPKADAVVTYAYGFYLIAATGGVAVIGTFCTLILTHTTTPSTSEFYGGDDACLIDAYDDGLETFDAPIPPPPYNVPPPPYVP